MGTTPADDWVDQWNSRIDVPNNVNCNMMSRLIRDVRRQERTDMRNRFLSIQMDAQFVSELVAAYRRAGCAYPVFANLRNGLWYGKDWDGACYFKSTDGHSRRWSFSYTRLNMHLAASAAASGGCIVVDSTRTGKRFPDSFTATVPIWCCVLNRLAIPERKGSASPYDGADEEQHPALSTSEEQNHLWDTTFHAPRWLSASEASQIEERIPGWLAGLGDVRDALSKRLRSFLKKPLRPIWLSPESRLVEGMLPACCAIDLSFTAVICVSASKVIIPERHREHHSWTYLQGAGDDEEHWSAGLTPETFWENSERLVRLANSGDRAEFEGVMDELLAKSKLRTSAPDSANQQNKAPGMALTDGGSSNYSMANKGGDGGEADVWRPGGPLFHAALGKTGLELGSLASLAQRTSPSGEDCFLLNLSDQSVPASVVNNLVGSSNNYLHIPVKAGKKANPPRYWKTEVFPSALAFIASSIGGVTLRGQADGSGAENSDHIVGPTSTSAVGAGPQSSSRVYIVNSDSAAGDELLQEKSRTYTIKVSSPHVETPKGIACCELEPARLAQEAFQSSGAGKRRDTDPRQQIDLPSKSCCTRAAGRGRCVVVCPTGAEASVIVCLAALLALFAPALETMDSGGRATNTSLRGQPPPTKGTHEGFGMGRGESFRVLRRGSGPAVTKADVRWQFLLLQQECPWARPPRRLMQELNEYFMTPGKYSWWTLSDHFV